MINLYQYGFFTVNSVSILLNLISILVPWLSFSATSPSQVTFSSTNTGSIYLYQTVGCSTYTDSVPSNVVKGSCSLITISNLPDTLSYIKNAANVGLAFTILSLFTNIFSGFIEYLSAFNKTSLIPMKLSFLGHINTPILLNSLIMIFNIIAFSSFSALINSNFNMNTDGMVLGFGGTTNRSWNYGGGFGLSIVVYMLSTVIFIGKFIQKNRMKSDENKTILNPMIPPPEVRPENTV
jgi:hypothetical protein